MKKLLFIAALIVTGSVAAQDITTDFAMAVKAGDMDQAKSFITEESVNECHDLTRKKVSMMVFILSTGNDELLKYAVEEKNGDVNIQCGKYTPLSWAAKNGSAETVAYLLQQGADKSIATKGKTAMDWAQYYKRNEIIALLD